VQNNVACLDQFNQKRWLIFYSFRTWSTGWTSKAAPFNIFEIPKWFIMTPKVPHTFPWVPQPFQERPLPSLGWTNKAVWQSSAVSIAFIFPPFPFLPSAFSSLIVFTEFTPSSFRNTQTPFIGILTAFTFAYPTPQSFCTW
jgi:hypothetical protein